QLKHGYFLCSVTDIKDISSIHTSERGNDLKNRIPNIAEGATRCTVARKCDEFGLHGLPDEFNWHSPVVQPLPWTVYIPRSDNGERNVLLFCQTNAQNFCHSFGFAIDRANVQRIKCPDIRFLGGNAISRWLSVHFRRAEINKLTKFSLLIQKLHQPSGI